jgi:hypothetical protein
MKKNCWEAKQCGRQAGGEHVGEFGECPAFTETRQNGKNSGKNAGRYCWKVAGTFCDGNIQGSYAAKLLDCVKCEFYKNVRMEEGDRFVA